MQDYQTSYTQFVQQVHTGLDTAERITKLRQWALEQAMHVYMSLAAVSGDRPPVTQIATEILEWTSRPIWEVIDDAHRFAGRQEKRPGEGSPGRHSAVPA